MPFWYALVIALYLAISTLAVVVAIWAIWTGIKMIRDEP